MINYNDTVSLGPKSKKPSWKQFSKAFLNASPNAIVVTDCSLKAAISNQKAQDNLDIFTGTLIKTTLPELHKSSNIILKNTSPI